MSCFGRNPFLQSHMNNIPEFIGFVGMGINVNALRSSHAERNTYGHIEIHN